MRRMTTIAELARKFWANQKLSSGQCRNRYCGTVRPDNATWECCSDQCYRDYEDQRAI